MAAFHQLPVELQVAIVRHLPFLNQLRLRLVNLHWNNVSVQALDLILVWCTHTDSGVLLPLNSVSTARWIHQTPFPTVEELRQSQLVSRVYKVRLNSSLDDGSLAKIRALDSCFQQAVLRPLELELELASVQMSAPGGAIQQTTLAQQCPQFHLVDVFFDKPSSRATNYLLGQSSHLQQINTLAVNLVSLHMVPRQWNSTLANLDLSIVETASGAACIRMMADNMRNLRRVSLEIQCDIPDKAFFTPLVSLQQLRELEIMGGSEGYHCELPVFPAPGLMKLRTLYLQLAVQLSRDRHLFKRMPWLESLVLLLPSENYETKESFENESRQVMDVFIDNCIAGALPNLKTLELQPFVGRSDPDDDEGLLDNDNNEIWQQALTLDFDIARIFSAACKCPKLKLLKLTGGVFRAQTLSADVLLTSLEQCPNDYLLASPRAIQVGFFQLEHFLEEPQLLLDYAIGMVRTGLQRLELVVRISGNRRAYLAKRKKTQELVANTIRLLALDLPQLSAADILQESFAKSHEWNWSEAIVIVEADCGRKHKLKLQGDD